MGTTEVILPDLQSCVLCEDVRHEFNGMQTLVGVINIVPAPQLPITCMRLCIWSRWCSGAGKFKQRSRIIGVDEQQVLAQAEVEFELKESKGTPRTYITLAEFSSSNLGCTTLRFICRTNCNYGFRCR
jgi:hypothetical protein